MIPQRLLYGSGMVVPCPGVIIAIQKLSFPDDQYLTSVRRRQDQSLVKLCGRGYV